MQGYQLLDELQRSGKLHQGDASILRTVKSYCANPVEIEAVIRRAEVYPSSTTVNINVGTAAPPTEKLVVEHRLSSDVKGSVYVPEHDFNVDPITQRKIKILVEYMGEKDAKNYFNAFNRMFKQWYNSFVEDINEQVKEFQNNEKEKEKEEEQKLLERKKQREKRRKEEEEIKMLEEEEMNRKREKRLQKLRKKKYRRERSKKLSSSSSSDSENGF